MCLRCRYQLPIDQIYGWYKKLNEFSQKSFSLIIHTLYCHQSSFYKTWVWFYNFPLKTLSWFPKHIGDFKLFIVVCLQLKIILTQPSLYQEENMRVKISTIFHTRSTPRVLVSVLDSILPNHHQQIQVSTTPTKKKQKETIQHLVLMNNSSISLRKIIQWERKGWRVMCLCL